MTIVNKYEIFENSGNNILSHAFIISPSLIELRLKSNSEIDLSKIEIFEYDYSEDLTDNFPIKKSIIPINIELAGNIINLHFHKIDLSKNYILKYHNEQIDIYLDYKIGGILDTIFKIDKEQQLGFFMLNGVASFRLWSPPAAKIEVVFYDKNQNIIESGEKFLMTKSHNGIWSIDLKSFNQEKYIFYQYKVYAYGKAKLALDPYALSMATFSPFGDDKIGKAATICKSSEKFDLNSDIKFSNAEIMASENDLVAYEVHIRDFTIEQAQNGNKNAGTYLGFSEKIHHLKDLGVSHVQFLPIMKFFTVEETNRDFSGQDSRQSNYNWGYDSLSYFSPEGWFSSDATNPYTRILELKELINELHNNKIGVILDVVYNHSFSVETFENLAPGCYFRLDENLNISKHTGAGPTIESRRWAVRKLIIDSLKHYVEFYKVDGFRFDLMSFMDHETIRLIRHEVGKVYNNQNINELILHGEAWVFSDLDTSTDSEGENAAFTKLNYPKEDLNIGIFNDTCRDSILGRDAQQGFIQGNNHEISRVASSVMGGLKDFQTKIPNINNDIFKNPYNSFSYRPNNSLNFLTVHDGHTLWDKLNLSTENRNIEHRIKLMKQTAMILLTSQGKIILHAGDEILRSKPLSHFDKNRNRAHTSPNVIEENGIVHFHENSYSSNDFTNMIRWSRLNNQYAKYAREMKDFYKSLIEIRRNLAGLRMCKKENILNGLKFISNSENSEKFEGNFNTFSDENLKELSIIFINGPKNQKMFLAGEIQPKNVDANPQHNPYSVEFDHKGIGVINFDKKEIKAFDQTKWSNDYYLHFKLVNEAGKWETNSDFYSYNGNNFINSHHIDKDGKIVIDLSIKNYNTYDQFSDNSSILTYWIDNSLEKASKNSFINVKEILISHNTSKNHQIAVIENIRDINEWKIICSNETPLMKNLTIDENMEYSSNLKRHILYKLLIIPPHTSMILVS